MAASAAPPWLLDADLAAPKYNEAVAVAAEKCAGDTKGQTCYICTEALHWKTKEGLVRMCACRGTAGFVHVSCLAEQAKTLVAEAEENNLVDKLAERWARWHTCRLCEQGYHGVVACALGWACWKTYVGRPETDAIRLGAMTQLGNGLQRGKNHEDALPVYEAELSMIQRLGASEDSILVVQNNLANTYSELGRLEEALRMRLDVYSGRLRLNGQDYRESLVAAGNVANVLIILKRFEEARSLLRKTIPAARRVLGECDETTLRMRWNYAEALYRNPAATLDDLREAVTTHEETERTARRVFGCSHPLAVNLERDLRQARAALRARESLLAQYLLYAASALALGAFALAQRSRRR
jgi:tetratricopeptide (TPR) repeat protein